MLNQLIITIISMIAAIFAIMKIDMGKKKHRENFINVPLTYKTEPVAGPTMSDMYAVPSYYQSALAPRFSNLSYGANINYNMPSKKYQAVPTNPLGYSDMVQENFTGCGTCKGGCKSPPDCAKGGVGGNIAQAMQQQAMNGQGTSNSYADAKNSLRYTEATSMLPVKDMKSKGLSALSGGKANPIIYDRYIYANQKSRLYALGDPIRGDLPIVPCKSDWFRPSVHPNIDLRDGALAVIGGVHNQTSNKLHALQSLSTGGVYNTLGGVDYGVQKNSFINPANDVTVSSFP